MDKVHEFLKVSHQFKLGHLTTESPHPLTQSLSQLAQSDPCKGIEVLQSVDTLALKVLPQKSSEIWSLHQNILTTFKSNHKVFMVGCGATGRLSLVLETLSLQLKVFEKQIISFMAGGDFALIKSVESFEDHAAYGARQLMELGFEDGDLLLAITEGGETPFVIGACMKAVEVSHNNPWFLYCNPDSELMGLERCREVLTHKSIHKLNLTCGPMALTGSTRMQASTVLMAAAGLALLYEWKNKTELADYITGWLAAYLEKDLSGLEAFIVKEADALKSQKLTTYIADRAIAISVLTDTTERAPTFSQPGFENLNNLTQLSPIYLAVNHSLCSSEAWSDLLYRSPRCLEWDELQGRVNNDVLMGFDISENAIKRRQGEVVSIHLTEKMIEWRREDFTWKQFITSSDPLLVHLELKMCLNIYSTLMMGRCGFYLDNIMSWVRPSNFKLIDRASRYVIQLAKTRGHELNYEDVAGEVILELEKNPDDAVVIRVLKNRGTKL
jgi:N-acetylmuramic acid 6-phosphate etherase